MRSSLHTLAKIHYGKSPNEVLSTDGHIPIVGTGGIYGHARHAMFNEGVVVARKGSLGKPQLFKTPFWPVDTTYAVTPFPGICMEWLYYCLLNFDLTKLNEATGVPSISRNWLEKIAFHNPGEPSQKRIGAILTSVDTAIEKTEALIAKYQQIKAGLMHDLFTRGMLPDGTLRPLREHAPELYKETVLGWIPRAWAATSVGTLLMNIQTGKSPSCRNIAAVGGDWGVLKVSAVHPDGFRSNQNKIIEKTALIDTSYEVQDGDLLMTRANTPELIGLVCLVDHPQSKLMLCDKTLRLIVNEKFISKEFMFACLQQSYVRVQIENSAAGTSMSMKNISQSSIRSIRIAFPKLDEQVLVTSSLAALKKKLLAEGSKLKNLRAQKLGLMQDLLTGKVPVEPAPEPLDTTDA